VAAVNAAAVAGVPGAPRPASSARLRDGERQFLVPDLGQQAGASVLGQGQRRIGVGAQHQPQPAFGAPDEYVQPGGDAPVGEGARVVDAHHDPGGHLG
jgi:hypothetical protein